MLENNSAYRHRVNTSQLLLILWVLISSLLIFINIRTIVSFTSYDEQLFLNFSNEVLEYNFIRYVIWGFYIEKLSSLSLNLPILINLIIFYFSLRSFITYFKPNNVFIISIFLIPSLLFYSTTYLRDFVIVAFLFYIITFLKDFQSKNLFKVLILISLVFLLRPQMGLVIILAIIIAKYLPKINPHIPSIFILIITSLVIVNIDSLRESFKDYYYTLNLNDSISLFEFEIYDVSNLELYCTIFFNWILFWFGLNLESQTNDYYLLIFMIEAFIYGILFFLSFFMYKNYKYKKSFVYRFCFLILLSSIFFSIFEAEWASVYRHKLFFIPVLLYLSNVNSLKK